MNRPHVRRSKDVFGVSRPKGRAIKYRSMKATMHTQVCRGVLTLKDSREAKSSVAVTRKAHEQKKFRIKTIVYVICNESKVLYQAHIP